MNIPPINPSNHDRVTIILTSISRPFFFFTFYTGDLHYRRRSGQVTKLVNGYFVTSPARIVTSRTRTISRSHQSGREGGCSSFHLHEFHRLFSVRVDVPLLTITPLNRLDIITRIKCYNYRWVQLGLDEAGTYLRLLTDVTDTSSRNGLKLERAALAGGPPRNRRVPKHFCKIIFLSKATLLLNYFLNPANLRS